MNLDLLVPPSRRPGPPELPVFGDQLEHTLARARARLPAVAPSEVQVWIRRQPALACVSPNAKPVLIHLHSVLNHHQTPPEVLEYILIHELIHLAVPSREVDGKLSAHPPEFWELERRVAPERSVAWHWIYSMLWEVLRVDREAEATWVKRTWKGLMVRERWSMVEALRRFEEDQGAFGRLGGEPVI